MARSYICSLILCCTISGQITTAALPQVSSLAVQRGNNVMLPCSLNVTAGYLFWFKHGPNDSVPLCILSRFIAKESKVKYHKGFMENHIKLHQNNSACEILNVDFSDSGQYFCGNVLEDTFFFGKATHLKFEGEMPPTALEEGNCKESGGFPSSLSWALGGLVTIQFIVIFIIICRVTCAGKKSQVTSDDKQDDDPDTLNYAALNFTKNEKKSKRREKLEPHVVYAATR